MIKTENRADIKVCIRDLFIEKEKQKNESAGKRFIRMKRKQFLALILTVTLLAGSNITAAASVRTPAIRDAASAQGAMVEDGDTDQSSDKTLEQAMTDAIGQVSTGAAKEETVYVFTDAYGKQRDITVSNWLKNPEKKSTIEDESSLTDIENVKGDETFEQKGDKIVWKADGNDIFYQGTTTKQPPVTEKITYYLNDKEIKAEDLAGKSGKVRIHIDYTNNIKYKNVYVPFAAVTGMAFSNDTVSNIKVDNGSVVSEGKNSMVVGMAFPGLQDSLNTARQESKDIVNKALASAYDNASKAADTIDSAKNGLSGAKEDAEKAGSAVSDAAEDVNSAAGQMATASETAAAKAKETSDKADKLKDAAAAANSLSLDAMAGDAANLKKDAEETLAGDAQAIANDAKTIAGIGQAMSAPDEDGKTAADKMEELQKVQKGAAAVSQGMQTMYETLSSEAKQNELKFLKESGNKVKAGVSSVNTGVQALYESLYGKEGLNAGLSKMASKNDILNGGTKALQDGADALAVGIADANAGSIKLQKGIKEYTAGTDQLNKGTQTILDGTKKLSENSGKLNDGTDDLVDGVSKFVDGMQEMLDGCVELNDGVVEFREDGIRKMAEIYRENIKALDDSLMDIKDAAGTYKTFSGALDSTDNNVKFIIKTDSIELDED